jgi:putative DNA primase/helicase
MNDLDRAREALSFIPSHDRDLWIPIGMGLHNEFGDAGFDLWDEWSQGADNYDAAAVRTSWKGFRPGGGRTVATLFHEAKQSGWVPTGNYEPKEWTPAELAERQRKLEQAEAKATKDRQAAAAKARRIWNVATAAAPTHGYLQRKGLEPTATLRMIDAKALAAIAGYAPAQGDAVLSGEILVVPIKVGDALTTVELIDSAGHKTCLAGGQTKGGYWSPHPLPSGDGAGLTVYIGEGVATTLSVSAATDAPCVAARYLGNVPTVAAYFRAAYPRADLVILGEVGTIERHARAAQSVGGRLWTPDFGTTRREGDKDANDFAAVFGLEALRNALEGAPRPSPLLTVVEAPSAAWSEPEPLLSDCAAEPYPLEVLPSLIRDAIREAVDFVQCPVALAGSSALSALSAAGQALADVRRAENLQGPISLFTLGFYDSGERKTATDNLFAEPIREWERDCAVETEPRVAQYKAQLAGFEAVREGLLARIKRRSEKNEPSDAERQELEELERDRPVAPRTPRMLMVDATPEALAYQLAKNWPSGAILSSEAGIVFGGQSMKADSVMRNLSQLNVLWDGGRHRVDRKSSEGFTLEDVRLTMGLALQPDTMRAFLDATKGLARGTGFAARFLIAWPETTQGTRKFKEAPRGWPALSRFRRRIRELLEGQREMPLAERGGLSPALLTLSPGAQAAWIAFHDETEAELRPGGDMEQTRDVASKAADNAARVAALFHVLEHGPSGSISEEHMRAAGALIAWHLYEARRFLGNIALPLATINGARLERWLMERHGLTGEPFVRRQDVQRQGPNPLRRGKALDEAIAELESLHRARLVVEGRQKRIYLNPALVEGLRHAA